MTFALIISWKIVNSKFYANSVISVHIGAYELQLSIYRSIAREPLSISLTDGRDI